MKCIILGAGGQLGREWMEALHNSNASPFNHYRGFGSDQLDVTDGKAVAEVLNTEKPDIVVNCAAYTKVDKAEEQPELAEEVNSRAVRSLAEQCAERGIKLVHYSTDYVFPGRAEDRETLPDGYPEEHPADPVNWYGATKLKGERAVQQSGAGYLILRVSWLCGQYGANFVKTMLKLAEERDTLDLVNDQWGSPSFAENVVYNTMVLLNKNRKGVYHITSDGLITWYDFASELFTLTGKDIQFNPVPSDEFKTRAKRPYFSKLNTHKLQQVEETNIVDWKEGLERLLEELNY